MKDNWKAGPPTTDLSAEALVAAGYRRVSNAYGLVARIDREDWVEVLAQSTRRAPADFVVRDGTGRIRGSWCDYYRRVHSQDQHTVDRETFRLIPTSDHDPVGFVSLHSAPQSPEEKQQKWMDAFILRAGFKYGWENLESWARRMAEQAYLESAAFAKES